MPPSKAQEGGPSSLLPSPKKLPKTLLFYFYENELGSIPKNSGLNPRCFQFLGYLRLGPGPTLPPPPKPAAGAAGFNVSPVNTPLLWASKLPRQQ